ncbi:MAG TPA: type 1 glutamine amidotransferase [Bacteroidales bacterium]|nr:type 1 glutamine amidotransferase [Bacteroidales bacterium]
MKKLNIHYFQHVPFEDPGSITEWALAGGHNLTSTKFYEETVYPALSEIDWLVIMGGPMGVNDEDKYRWLAEEKKYIKRAIDAGKTVLGICLGSQLISSALGARVYRNGETEIGWFDITFQPAAKSSGLFSHLGDSWKVFHWHGDTFDLPDGAVLLAGSDACRHQAYLYGDRVLALQFHPEPNEELLKKMVDNGAGELIPGRYIMTGRDELINGSLTDSVKKDLFLLLNKLPGQ